MFMDDDTRGNYAPAGFCSSAVAFRNLPGTNIRDGNYTVNCGPGAYG